MVNMEIPVHLEPYLEIESCKDFPVDRYYVSAQLGTIISEIIRIKKLHTHTPLRPVADIQERYKTH